MQIVIDPRSDILYSSYYISAIIDFFGSGNVSFNREPFRTFNVSHKNGFPNLNFVIRKEKEEDIRYSIQINDSWRIDEAIYDWCTIYGHVNARLSETPLEQYTKLVPLAPSFGIGFLSVFQTLKLSIQNLIQIKNLIYLYDRPLLHSLRFHFGIYKRCFQRCKLQDYSSEIEPSGNYVFHLSTLWYDNEWNKNDLGLNNARAMFIRACKSLPEIEFEGGFTVDERSSISKFQDCISADFRNRIPLKTWIEKTKRSFVVFNTPAFWNCHGWKLAEYLAMGKAIISTPLANDLPAPLIHGTHIHIVKNDQLEILEAIRNIQQDTLYRKKLERGSREWWDHNGTPNKVLELLGIMNQ